MWDKNSVSALNRKSYKLTVELQEADTEKNDSWESHMSAYKIKGIYLETQHFIF